MVLDTITHRANLPFCDRSQKGSWSGACKKRTAGDTISYVASCNATASKTLLAILFVSFFPCVAWPVHQQDQAEQDLRMIVS